MRLLLPREHGTYAQLVFPLLSGLVLGRPGLAAAGLALAVAGLFLCYEPLALLIGTRGVRRQREEARAARRQLTLLAPAALLLGGAALLAAPPTARLLALFPAGIAALLLPLMPARLVRTLAGETLVAGALASVHLPVAAAAGVRGLALWGPAAVWFVGFFLATLAVHAIKARHKQRRGWIGLAATLSPMLGLLAAVVLAGAAPSHRTLAAALAVPLLAVLAVNAAHVHPRSLQRVGWTLVAANTLTLVLLTLL